MVLGDEEGKFQRLVNELESVRVKILKVNPVRSSVLMSERDVMGLKVKRLRFLQHF